MGVVKYKSDVLCTHLGNLDDWRSSACTRISISESFVNNFTTILINEAHQVVFASFYSFCDPVVFLYVSCHSCLLQTCFSFHNLVQDDKTTFDRIVEVCFSFTQLPGIIRFICPHRAAFISRLWLSSLSSAKFRSPDLKRITIVEALCSVGARRSVVKRGLSVSLFLFG